MQTYPGIVPVLFDSFYPFGISDVDFAFQKVEHRQLVFSGGFHTNVTAGIVQQPFLKLRNGEAIDIEKPERKNQAASESDMQEESDTLEKSDTQGESDTLEISDVQEESDTLEEGDTKEDQVQKFRLCIIRNCLISDYAFFI